MIWTDLATAPAPGTVVTEAATLCGAATLTVTSAAGDFPLLLVRTEQGVRAYVNMCPHQFLPLDYRGRQILSHDRQKLMCSAHGAMFDAQTGVGVAGNGLGCSLVAVPLTTVGAQVLIGD